MGASAKWHISQLLIARTGALSLNSDFDIVSTLQMRIWNQKYTHDIVKNLNNYCSKNCQKNNVINDRFHLLKIEV